MKYYEGKIKVVGADLMCFPADPITLEALSTSTYDPWAWSDPDPTPIRTISHEQWLLEVNNERQRSFTTRRI